MGLDLGMG
jgi:hypothetical protein